MRDGKVKRLTPLVLIIWLVVSACSWERAYHATPLEALTEFPGYLTKENLGSALILQEEAVAGGLVLLYLYPSDEAGPTSSANCLATTFVTQERNGGWRPQSAGRIGCGKEVFAEGGFTATYTVGGNITELTTAYGLSEQGHQVNIEWSDGTATVVPVIDGAFLRSRPETLQVQRMELLDRDGAILETIQIAD